MPLVNVIRRLPLHVGVNYIYARPGYQMLSVSPGENGEVDLYLSDNPDLHRTQVKVLVVPVGGTTDPHVYLFVGAAEVGGTVYFVFHD